jgi:hypothetical protein
MYQDMTRPLLIPNPGNATIEELKHVSRVGSSETATRCTAIQMLLAGADRDLVCQALVVTNRAYKSGSTVSTILASTENNKTPAGISSRRLSLDIQLKRLEEVSSQGPHNPGVS